VKWATRKFVKEKEIRLARNIKNNSKILFNYVSSKTKPKEAVSNLITPSGDLTNDDKGKADVLNNFFASVFTVENVNNIPSFDCRTTEYLSHITVMEEKMCKKTTAVENK